MKQVNLVDIGESINDFGREFKYWFMEFTLVYSPILIVTGLILTGLDLFLNLGISNSMWYKLPWSIAQLFAVDGLWFAVWNRILTDDYKKELIPYHAFLIAVGICLTGIAIVMNFIVFTQDYMKLSDGLAAMRYIGIPVYLFLLVRSILLMATATLAIILDRVLRTKKRRSTHKPAIPEQSITVIPESKPVAPLLIPEKAGGYKESIREYILTCTKEGKSFTYQDIVEATGAKLPTVKLYAPAIKKELIPQTDSPDSVHPQ